jgi:Periplasmic copper-binding protein (NosD)
MWERNPQDDLEFVPKGGELFESFCICRATSNGSGIFAFGYDAQTELTNNIIVAKPGQSALYFLTFSDQNSPIIRFNNIFSASGMAYAGAIPDMTGTNGNISADPLFTNPTQGDYHLQQGSPSIDSGYNLAPNLPDTDIDEDPRILDGDGNGTATVDMGVDEFRRTIRVPSDQPGIQAAINVATDGDRVLVAPGTYFEHIDFRGKAITVTSESGPQVTIIDAGNTDPVVSFTSGEGRDSVLNGFTLQNGRTNFSGEGAPPNGGGIVIQRASPTITNNVITNNHASRGSGIGIVFGSPLIQLNTITANINDVTIGGGGGGILISGEGSAEILDNVISNNVNNGGGGGIYISGAGATPIIKRNVIKGNSVALGAQGGGIYTVNDSSPLIVQNLITGNHASYGGGVYWAVSNGVRGPILVNNTIADNDVTTNGSGIFADGADGQVELTNNIIVAKPGQTGLYCGPADGHIDPIIRFNNIFSADGMAYGGSCDDRTGMDDNISADPLFTNSTQGDYHLQQGSPSIDSGDILAPNLPDKDIDGHTRIMDGDGNGTAIVDMGVYEFLAPSNAVWNFIPRRSRSFTAKIPIGAGSPNTLSSISWAIPFNLGGT